MRKISIVLPSPFSDNYGKVKSYLATYHQEDAVYDEKGYCITPTKLIKVVRKELPSCRIKSILPK